MEKQSFDENFQKDLELKKAKLIEILVKYNNFYTLYKYFWNKFVVLNIQKQQREHEARMLIKKDLDIYKNNLLKKREQNLKMKYSLSMMKHCHAVSKPYELAYMSQFTLKLDLRN